MKAVLLSVRHQHIVDMHSGKKTSELRTKFPKIPTPFKVYNFDTVSSGGCGKVVSEWVCRDITEWLMYMGIPAHLSIVACVSNEHIWDYCEKGNKNIGEMRISNLVIYDKLKELSEFYHYCGDNPNCEGCEVHYYSNTECGEEDYCCSVIEGCKPIKRPPQSWCYVEEMGCE